MITESQLSLFYSLCSGILIAVLYSMYAWSLNISTRSKLEIAIMRLARIWLWVLVTAIVATGIYIFIK